MTLPPPGPRPADPRPPGRRHDGVADPVQTIDRASEGLAGLADRPLAEHVAVFERIHSALGDALAAGSAVGEASGRA
jgi:hypothetical protein